MSASTGLKMNAANFPAQSRSSDISDGVVRHNHAVAISNYITERGYCVTGLPVYWHNSIHASRELLSHL